jgi:hypothetical protein
MADANDGKLELYTLQVQALTDQYGRMWTRFNFFLTLHTALAVALIGLFEASNDRDEVVAIPLIGVVTGLLWYVAGAEDRYLVCFYREMITYAAHRLEPGTGWVHSGLPIDEAEQRLVAAGQKPIKTDVWQWRSRKASVTKLAAIVPAVFAGLWLAAGVLLAVSVI